MIPTRGWPLVLDCQARSRCAARRRCPCSQHAMSSGARARRARRRVKVDFSTYGSYFRAALAQRPSQETHSLMEQSAKEAWKRLLEEARRELSDATVRTWLEPAVPIALDDDRLIVGAPDQFAVEWNESKHAGLLARAAERVLGRPTAVVFRVQEDRQHRPQMDFFVAPRDGGPDRSDHAAQRALHVRELRHR